MRRHRITSEPLPCFTAMPISRRGCLDDRCLDADIARRTTTRMTCLVSPERPHSPSAGTSHHLSPRRSSHFRRHPKANLRLHPIGSRSPASKCQLTQFASETAVGTSPADVDQVARDGGRLRGPTALGLPNRPGRGQGVLPLVASTTASCRWREWLRSNQRSDSSDGRTSWPGCSREASRIFSGPRYHRPAGCGRE